MSRYKNIPNPSTKTKEKRDQLKSLLDDFTSFSWRGYDAFDNFGAFIINNKEGSLKFYNGPSFSNEYSKTQFDLNGGEFLGVTYNKQKIDFTIGLYWFSIEEYRYFLDWLDPLVTDTLIFAHSKKYRYNVKLSNISDSTKWVVGSENGSPRYYTEINLSFEVQGAPVAISTFGYAFNKWEVDSSLINSDRLKTTIKTTITDFVKTDLPTPLEFSFPLLLHNNEESESSYTYNISFEAIYHHNADNNDPDDDYDEVITLFSLGLEKLTHSTSDDNSHTLHIRYNSETGLLYLKYANTNEKLITQQILSDTGERFVSSFMSNKFVIPGVFEEPYFNYNLLEFSLKISKFEDGSPIKITEAARTKIQIDAPKIISYARTNIA